MTRSMTGWGRAEALVERGSLSIEARSLNSRYLDISLKAPEYLGAFESRIRDEVKKRISRGGVSISIAWTERQALPELRINMPVARAYMDAGAMLRKELGADGKLGIEFLLKQRDVLYSEERQDADDSDWDAIRQGLNSAFDGLLMWREKEGAAISSDLSQRLSAVEGHLKEIEGHYPEVVRLNRERLAREMERLLGERVDAGRIALEAAVFAERTDVAEEISRLKSHIKLFKSYLAMTEPVGKRLDFLCQEFLREANTIGSKSADSGITGAIIEIKGLIDMIREQVQNIE